MRPDEADEASTDAAMTRLWRNVGRTMAEFSVLDRLWAAGRIAVAGLEHLDAARATGTPLMFLGVHLGNWETIRRSRCWRRACRGEHRSMRAGNRFDHMPRQSRARPSRRRTSWRGPMPPSEAFISLTQEKAGHRDVCRRTRARPRVGAGLRAAAAARTAISANAVRLARLAGAIIVPLYSVRVHGQARFRGDDTAGRLS